MQFQVRVNTPRLAARIGREDVAGALGKLLASGETTSKADLGRATGMSRTTIDAGIGLLVELGVIRSEGLQPSNGRGRPAEVLRLDSSQC